jgi:tRNA (guanine37-N1)-methyltransferase
MIEACVRLLPGVMGEEESKAEESFEQGLLEYPHFTRPQSFEGVEIPPVLTSGNHAEIARWRKRQAEAITQARRGDLWTHYEKGLRSAIGPASRTKPSKKTPPRSVS